jgi:glycosyltransferase involved in cell wall biosynthesis
MFNFLYRRFVAAGKRNAVKRSFTHVSGPMRFDLGDDEVSLICVGRDTAFYLQSFFDWHRNMGVRKFVYVDNGSSDDSVEIASRQPDTIVVRCSASFKDFEGLIRLNATQMFVRGGWRLVVDADELFDYPGSQNLSIEALLKELNALGATAVVSQMLDMIPNGGLENIRNETYEAAIASCNYYDITDIETYDYFSGDIKFKWLLRQNKLSNPNIKFYFGGIRRTLFGEDCCLSKHPLFKPGAGVLVLPNPHVSTGLICADFTALLRHYKFTGDFVARERRLLADQRVAHGETALRMKALKNKPDMQFVQPTSMRFTTTEALIDQGFLTVSDKMKQLLGLK